MQFTPRFVSEVAKSNFVKQVLSGVLTIDNSESSNWFSCHPMGLYSGGLRRVAAKARAPLSFGGAVHAGLDTFLSDWKLGVSRNDSKWLDAALADAAITGLDDLGDSRRNTTVLQSILEAYTLEYVRNRQMQFDIQMVDGKPGVEQSFAVPLGEIAITGCKNFPDMTLTIMWSGKIDVVIRYDGAIGFVDHKTTTVMGEKFIDDKVRSTQMLGYTFAERYLAKHLFPGEKVFGGIINALALRTTGFEFKRFDIPLPDWKVAEWQRECTRSIYNLVKQLDYFLSTGEAVPTREHCVTKYGKCPYFDLCDAPAMMRDRMVFDDSYFFVSDWSPLNE